jgi:predicted Fe-Mo cluster-binding NifX family protein
MKIAIVTDDGKTISAHFGRAPYYRVVTIEDGQVVGHELREKHAHGAHHEHGHGGGSEIHLHEGGNPQAEDAHNKMTAPVRDCQVVLSRGMGNGAYMALRQAGLRPIITDVREIDEAVRQYVAGELVDHPERLH